MITNAIELLQQLIRIPSVNPDDQSDSASRGEGEIAAFLKVWLEEIGAEVVLEEIKPERPNLIARFAPRDGRPRILFGPHLDTVGVANMRIDPFGAELRDAKIWGRGACDTKGSMTAMLWALREHAADLSTMPVAVDFVAFMGEESGQWGSKDFVKRHGRDYAFAVVGEPTSLDVVYTTKGSLWATLQATGRAAHSSMPEAGSNAVLKLARVLPELERRLREELATYTHDVLGHSTINIGTFHGGTRPNIVPDRAEAQLDIRVTPSLADQGGALPLLTRALAELSPEIQVTYSHENPPMETDSGLSFVQLLLDARYSAKTVGAPWFSDAAHLSHGGIPSVCMGPGSIHQAHTADEFLVVDELLAGVAHFSRFIGLLKQS
jgi:acetylornithine deacetylase/succinyl-diaminopimelate desuccinylase-like protein